MMKVTDLKFGVVYHYNSVWSKDREVFLHWKGFDKVMKEVWLTDGGNSVWTVKVVKGEVRGLKPIPLAPACGPLVEFKFTAEELVALLQKTYVMGAGSVGVEEVVKQINKLI